jgi:hypothetical protein
VLYRSSEKKRRRRLQFAVSLVIDTNSSRLFIEKYLFKVQEVEEACNIKPIYRPDSGDCLAQAHSIASKLNGLNSDPQTQTQNNNSDYVVLNQAIPLTFKEIKENANIQDTTQNEIILSHELQAKMEPMRILH